MARRLADTSGMRRAVVCGLLSAVLSAGVVAAAPAFAAFGAVVQLPSDQLYSPFGGPVTVTFVFDESDDAQIFTVRLREPGKPAIRERDYLIDPAAHTSPHDVSFFWAELSVEEPTGYVIDVRPQAGGGALTSDTFTLLPKLVTELSVSPSPFFPLVDDGYKDHTRVGFTLSADTTETIVHVFADDESGLCCGNEVRAHDLGSLAGGDHVWSWDGRRDNGLLVPKGTYFVRVEATDLNDARVMSRMRKVVVTTGKIRLTDTKVKDGSAYARVVDEVDPREGGCIVGRDPDTRTASVLCLNATVALHWSWNLKPDERIESASFVIETGYYGCNRSVDHTNTASILRVSAPPSSSCTVVRAKITYSYPVQV